MNRRIYTQEEIDEMRRRLYDRGSDLSKPVRHGLTDNKVDVARDWSHDTATTEPLLADSKAPSQEPAAPATATDTSEPVKPKRRYRLFILAGSIILFSLVAVSTSLYLYFGGNQISSSNVQIAITADETVSGGEVFPLQVTVSNQNPVPIESAVLILTYPNGTRSVEEPSRSLNEERIPLDTFAVGETNNIPLQVSLYGEEGEEKSIDATVEYRVNNSNGTFFKDAEPHVVRITSSPVVLQIETTKNVSSGQLVDVILTATSNASRPLTDLIVTATYPNGFSYQSATPEPDLGQDVWRIDALATGESTTIELQGIVTGIKDSRSLLNFSIGPVDPDNQYQVGAALDEESVEFVIEQPLIDLVLAVDGSTNSQVVLDQGANAAVSIDIKNTLDETVYDMLVEVVPGGNALSSDSINSKSGFYDFDSGTVRFEVADNPSFSEVQPGSSRQLAFTARPGDNRTTTSFDLVVNVYARRASAADGQEVLIGTERIEAKYASSIFVGAQASWVSGPIPPEVGKKTTYDITIAAEAGANDLADVTVETGLPGHVTWAAEEEIAGLNFNPTSKQLRWNAGSIEESSLQSVTFPVSFTPSPVQANRVPVLLNSQSIRATDRFTDTLLQGRSTAVTTEISTEYGYEPGNGRVVAN